MIKIDKLYELKSIVDNFDGNNSVVIYWYYADQKWADANYNSIIKGYDDMSQEEKKTAEMVINEYFTLDEIEFIRPYLKGKFNNLKVEEVSLPKEFKFFNKNHNEFVFYRPFSFRAAYSDTIYLEEEKDYDLPFKVWGIIYPINNTSKQTSKVTIH